MSGSIIGTKNGLTLLGPRLSITWICSERVIMPPIPLAIFTEILLQLEELISRFELDTASRLATHASCTNRSILADSFNPKIPIGSKSVISAAIVVSNSEVSKDEI